MDNKKSSSNKRVKLRKNFRGLTQYKQQIEKPKKGIGSYKRNIGQEILNGIKEIKNYILD